MQTREQEVKEEAQPKATAEAAAKETLFHGTESWYSGANIEGKHQQFIVHLGGQDYFQHLIDVADKGYEGFVMQAEQEVASAG